MSGKWIKHQYTIQMENKYKVLFKDNLEYLCLFYTSTK